MIVEFVSLLIVLFAYSSIAKSRLPEYQKRKKLLITVGVIIVMVSGLRNLAVGADTYQYYLSFQDVLTTPWNQILQAFPDYFVYGIGKDPGYSFLVKSFQIIFPDFRCFLFVIIATFSYALLRLLYKLNVPLKGIIVSYLLYDALFYAFFSITGLRQTIATTVSLLVVPYVFSKKPIKFILPLLLFSLIHKSLLIFIVFYLFNYLKNPKRIVIYAAILFFPMWAVGQSLGQFLIAGTLFDQYEEYLAGTYDTNGAVNFAILFYAIILILITNYNKIESVRPENRILSCALAFAIFYTPMTAVGPSQMRIVQYYSIFLLVLLPDIIQSIDKKWGGKYYLVCFLLFAYACKNKLDYGFFWDTVYISGLNLGKGILIQGW